MRPGDSGNASDTGGETILLAGVGNMGGALLAGWLRRERGKSTTVTAVPRNAEMAHGARG